MGEGRQDLMEEYMLGLIQRIFFRVMACLGVDIPQSGWEIGVSLVRFGQGKRSNVEFSTGFGNTHDIDFFFRTGSNPRQKSEQLGLGGTIYGEKKTQEGVPMPFPAKEGCKQLPINHVFVSWTV